MRCIIHSYYTFKAIRKKNPLNLVTQKLTWDSQGKNLEKSGKSQGILKTSFSRHHEFDYQRPKKYFLLILFNSPLNRKRQILNENVKFDYQRPKKYFS